MTFSVSIALGRAETLDRVVAAVGGVAITESDLENEYRTEVFLSGKAPAPGEPDAATLALVRGRIIDQLLLDKEARSDGIEVAPGDSSVDLRLNELRSMFPSPERFEAARKALGLSEDELRSKFTEQEQILRLINRQLRPEATVEPAEIEAYYRATLIPEIAQRSASPPPALAQVEGRIREILTQQKIDVLLEGWLGRLRASGEVRFYALGDAGGRAEAASKP